MIIRRCGWHRAYFHRPKLLGVVFERRLRMLFTDGLCARCATRWRGDDHVPPQNPAIRAAVEQVKRELAAAAK